MVGYTFTWFLFLIKSKKRLTISNGISLISSKIIIIISPIDEYTMSGWCSLKNVHIQFNNYNPCYEKEMHYTLVSYNLFHETLRFIGILSYLNKIKHMQLIHYFPWRGKNSLILLEICISAFFGSASIVQPKDGPEGL